MRLLRVNGVRNTIAGRMMMGFLSSIGGALGAVSGLLGSLTGGSASSGSAASGGSLGSFTSPMQSVFSQFGQGTGMNVLNELIDDGGDDAAAASGLSDLAGSLG